MSEVNRTMRVLFLGAGASVGAGYPLTIELINEIESEFRNGNMVNARKDWQIFDSYRKNTTGELREVLESKNPELALTIPDLLEATLKEADLKTWKEVKKELDQGNMESAQKIAQDWEHPIREKLREADHAKRAFLRLVDNFFSHRHYEDSKDEKREKRSYLRKAFTSFQTGDTVITTNWDTLAERTLLDIGKWGPIDGYGFKVPLRSRSGTASASAQQQLLVPASVKVLKLHGSIGWFKKEDGRIYLRHARFLQFMNAPEHGDGTIDHNAPPPGSGPDMNPVMVVPSYIKALEDPVLLSIWDQADIALRIAGEVHFIGYSIPPADVAIRTLINPLRRRIAEGSVQVTVVNPDEGDRDRFVKFLGEEVTIVDKKAEEYWA